MEEVIEKNFDEGKLTNNKMLKLNKNERFAEDIEWEPVYLYMIYLNLDSGIKGVYNKYKYN